MMVQELGFQNHCWLQAFSAYSEIIHNSSVHLNHKTTVQYRYWKYPSQDKISAQDKSSLPSLKPGAPVDCLPSGKVVQPASALSLFLHSPPPHLQIIGTHPTSWGKVISEKIKGNKIRKVLIGAIHCCPKPVSCTLGLADVEHWLFPEHFWGYFGAPHHEPIWLKSHWPGWCHFFD